MSKTRRYSTDFGKANAKKRWEERCLRRREAEARVAEAKEEQAEREAVPMADAVASFTISPDTTSPVTCEVNNAP